MTHRIESQSLAEAIAARAQQEAAGAPGQFLPAPLAVEAEIRAAVAGAEADGPRWLARLRREGAEAFARQGFPTARNEDWHYTSTSAIAEAGYVSTVGPTGEVLPEQLRAFTFGQAAWPLVVFVNGRFDERLSRLDRLPDGVRVLPMARAMREQPDVLERMLGTDRPRRRPPVRGAQPGGVRRRRARGGQEGDGGRRAGPPPLPLRRHGGAHGGARAGAGVRGAALEAHGDRDARVDRRGAVPDQRGHRGGRGRRRHGHAPQGAAREPRAFHVAHVEARQGRDSHFVQFSFAQGAKLSRANVYTLLGGEGCGATLNGLYAVGGDQHCDHQTRIEHVEPNCYSRELYKGVLDGRSHGVFNGKVYVHPAAQKTDGKQTNNTLLLSDEARIDTKPQLEIFADDVKCTHGATVGRLDQTSLFYMKSRGIGDELARKLLTYAFAADVLETIELEPVRVGLEALTLERYAG
jgi:Fe-S cluster assembly protein SufD